LRLGLAYLRMQPRIRRLLVRLMTLGQR